MSTVSGYLYLDYLINESSEGDSMASAGPVVHRPRLGVLKSSYSDGSSAPNQADLVYSVTGSVSASGTVTVDLGTGGGLTNRFGESIVPFASVVAILLINRSTTAADVLSLGPHTTNGLSAPFRGTNPLVDVVPGTSSTKPGILYLENPSGWTVSDGSADTLRIVEQGGSNAVPYDLLILGRSA